MYCGNNWIVMAGSTEKHWEDDWEVITKKTKQQGQYRVIQKEVWIREIAYFRPVRWIQSRPMHAHTHAHTHTVRGPQWNWRIQFIDKNLFPMSSGASERASERTNEWAQRSAQAKQAVRWKRMSVRCEWTSERTSEWPRTLCVDFLVIPLWFSTHWKLDKHIPLAKKCNFSGTIGVHIFASCTLCKKPHLSRSLSFRNTFFWMTPYLHSKEARIHYYSNKNTQNRWMICSNFVLFIEIWNWNIKCFSFVAYPLSIIQRHYSTL